MVVANCRVSVKINLVAFPLSPLPLFKKKLALKQLAWLNRVAIFREIVYFPVPAILFSQKILFSPTGLS